ncbi:DUF5719 family protein [Nesterenkonia haasae]|uniref:DUF5719 family protein n=1 Tax=Nesterenkonia haasae TaxID=2587813 RepID=UPI001391AC4B|nr:DUF5719 family protein [Nesterenkonia haasae]NDK31008.1 hypothetical protein [Nesterenkonia haasae]
MTSRKVKKYIKAQQKARRRALKEQRMAESRDARPASRSTGSPHGVEETEPSPDTPRRPARSAQAARAVAALAGLSLVAVAVGSASMELAGDDEERTVVLEPYAVAGPEVTERLACPAVPGVPDSLSDQGVVDYADRDDSVTTSGRALVFAAVNGEFPTAEWYSLDDEGRGEAEPLVSAGEREDNTEGPLVDRPLTTGEFDTEQGLPLVEVEPLEGRSPSRAAVTAAGFTYSADSGLVTGMTAAMCEEPARSQWFLGPETGGGANSLLTLANPHSRDATAEVTTYDGEGDTGALGATTLLIPQNSVRTVNLAALVESDAQVAVHVQASGAPLAGQFQSARSSGGTGLGVEMLTALPGPQQQHTALGVPAGADEDPQMWFYVPGEDAVTVEFQVFDPEGQVETETPGVFTLEPGRVSAAGLHGLPAGTYDVVLNSDYPMFAAVRSAGDGEPVTVEVGGEPEFDPITGEELDAEIQEEETAPIADFSWSTAAEPLDAGSGVVLSSGYETELRFLAAQAEPQAQVTYRLFDSQGERTEDLHQEIAPGASAVVTYDELVDQAQSAGLEDLVAVVVASTEGEVYGGALSRDETGGFTSAHLVPISPSAQHVPLRIEQ